MIWLIGAGNMAIEYAKVLKAQNEVFNVIGRGELSAKEFESKTGIVVHRAPIDEVVKGADIRCDSAIVCVSTLSSFNITMQLLDIGFKSILVEKPAVLSLCEAKQLYRASIEVNANVYIGLNRRFYASVEKAHQLIKEDGGVRAVQFEFTEWSHVIEKLSKPKKELENWFLCNSLHVVDLAFSFSGAPAEMSCYHSGELSWHKPALFSGSGVTQTGVLFSYHADWQSAGRWAIEIQTRKRKIYLSPFEELTIQNKGSVSMSKFELESSLDIDFKPGLYKQTESFLGSKQADMVNVSAYVEMLPQYMKIAGY
ncbi:Gfo/Idh/MocA family oxidoreductase [Pseudoalteromonas sp. MMG013]|uniref:Gfo/Idh/MocA family oxidoreductase n=1 Tax=Pseudoalteromonas sp. MMG013 TaxID=2822687 RepID=UPI001B379765|nr:Gfo/Idh/MocA family oxidoreductase [Pseudoalteromonas sp. MMG013]MBQ4861994.1 Gfo/Idh/MocA family oxidoreductase [Pseudoalteromonas sp. MMG013]